MATTTELQSSGAARLPRDAGARLTALALGTTGDRLLLVLLGGAVAVAIVVIWLAELALPLSSDQALYSLIGRAIHHGAVPYRDLTDLKPPGIFYLRAGLDVLAPVAWSGACFAGPLGASCGWLVVKLADLLTTALFAIGLYATGRTMGFPRGAAGAAAALGALYTSLSYLSQLGLTPEKLAASCALLAVLLAARQRWLLAGVAVGATVLFKQPGGTVLVPVLLLAHSPGEVAGRWRRIGRVLGGFLMPLAVVGGVLAVQGALGAAIVATVGINVERIRTPASLGGFGGDNALQVAWQAFRDGLAPLWLLGAAGVLAAGRMAGRWRLVLLSWVLVDAVLLLRLRELLQLGPSLALLGGWAAGSVWQAAGQPPYVGFGRAGLARLGLLGVLAGLVVLASGYQESIVMRAWNERGLHGLVRSPDEFVADALGRAPAGPLFVWGEGTELYLLSGRAPASVYLNAIPLSANLPGAAARRAELMRQLAASMPAAIVLTPEVDRPATGLSLADFAGLQSLLEQTYAPLAEVEHDPKYGGWRIFVRRP